MNILRWKRKSKKKIKFKTIVLFIFSLMMTTFAWFAYSRILDSNLNIHMASWDMEYWIGSVQQVNPENGIPINISTLYPAMDEQTVKVDIYNNGETLVDIYHQIKSVTIAGTSYDIFQEGEEITSENYISLAEPILTTNASGEQIYKTVITNDITKFPFTIELEHSAEVKPISEDAYGSPINPGEGYLKVTANWIGDNNELDSEWGYIVGEYLESNPTAMTIVISVDSYQAENQERETITITETLPSTTETKPYLPTGFKRVAGTNLDTGLVIADASGNEYVWIEVPKSSSVYTNLNITAFTETEYQQIEQNLQAYVSEYTTRQDAHSSIHAIGLSPTDYDTYKYKMLKSVYQNGGFYIGRYETGIASGYRTGHTTSDPTQSPVIKPNVYPFNYVTCSQATTVAAKLAPTGYTSSLLFGLQWDLVLKYLETKGTPQSMLKTDSTTWGNYANNSYSITNSNAKYMLTNTWITNTFYEKQKGEKILFTPKANSGFCRQNIYDLAGNLAEWTYNLVLQDSAYVGGNGGDYLSNGTNSASHCGTNKSLTGVENVGFRVTFY